MVDILQSLSIICVGVAMILHLYKHWRRDG